MKSKIIALLLPVLLSGCGTALSDKHLSLIAPNVPEYSRDTMNKAADEIEGGKCPVLSKVMMPDYEVARDQSRELKKK